MKWETLNSAQQLNDLLNSGNTFAIFKHSTRCSISTMAKSRVERDWDLELPIYYLDLIQYRSVSNLIETVSGVMHESPQLIVFKNGKAIYDASHNAIMVNAIKDELVS